MHLAGPRPGLVWPVRPDPSGLSGPTLDQARGPGWRRTTRGLYVPARTQTTTAQRIVEAAAVLPAIGAVTGWGALSWLGAAWFTGLEQRSPLPVPLVTGTRDIRRREGLLISREGLGPRETLVVDGVRVTTPARSVLFEMRYAASLAAAVRVLDLALFDDLVSLAEMARYVAIQTGMTGIQRGRDALVLADENSWSPRETDLRLAWRIDAQLPTPLCNRPIFDLTGHHLATPDLFDPEAALAVEYDGELHAERRRRRRDRDRGEKLADHGIETLVVMAGDPRAEVVDRMIRTRRRRLLVPQTASWTLEPPGWWAPTHTVALRRALESGERAVWLGHRRLAG